MIVMCYCSMQEDIRAPIPQMNEQLIDEQVYAGGVAGRRRATRSVFDGFRDFQAETSKSSTFTCTHAYTHILTHTHTHACR